MMLMGEISGGRLEAELAVACDRGVGDSHRSIQRLAVMGILGGRSAWDSKGERRFTHRQALKIHTRALPLKKEVVAAA
jgi:hypothetical protein